VITRVLLVARNAFRAIVSKRAIYIWGLAVILMFMRSAPAIFMDAEPMVMQFVRANAVSGAMDLWALLCVGAAILLGAGSVANEIGSKTIVTLLARPVRRWEVLLGKWIGITAFVVLSLAIGVALDLVIASYIGVEVQRTALAMAIVHTIAAAVLLGGVAIALSGGGSMILAGAITVLLVALPGLIEALVDHPRPIPRAAGKTIDALTPPGYDSLYDGTTWAPFPRRANARGPVVERPRPTIDFQAERKEVYANLAYAAAYFLLGCAFFTRKDVNLG
jgi:ABC-type Na+ efflux pump permease subunit